MRTWQETPGGNGAPERRAVGFAQRLGDHGDRVALIDPDGEHLTYRELAGLVAERGRDWGPARRLVLVEGANEVEPIVTYLAALAHGHPVLVVPGEDAGRTAELVRTYDPDITWCPSGGDVRVTIRREVSVHDLHPSLALLMSTSGSTGSAKLVRLSHDNLASNAAAIASYLELGPGDRAITSLPLHYCYGLSVLHSHLLRGAGVVLTDTSVVDRCFWTRVTEHGVTGLAGVPHTFDLLDRVGFDSMDLPSLRWVSQAGGRLAPERVRHHARVAERHGRRFFVMYGQTEATARMAYLPPEHAATHPECIGRPIPGGSFRIDSLPGEAHGELVYRGPNVMLGYARGPADLGDGRTVDELRTGDLAQLTGEGFVRIVGRASRFIKPFGVRVDLDGVEAMLSEDGLAAACTGDDEQLVVALTGSERDTDDESVRATLRARLGLPPSRIAVVRVDELPRLANGKVDYPSIERRADDATTDPASPVGRAGPEPARRDARAVRDIYAQVLGVAVVRDSDTFVSLGGDSLSYVETSLRLEQELGFVPDSWHLSTVGELDRLAPRHATGARRWWRRVETNVALRALAIALVVCTHSTVFKQQGGAHLLFALAGFNFARFQLPRGDTSAGAPDSGTRRRLESITRIVVPTLGFTALAMATRDGFSAANVFLVHNYVGDGRWWYWYIEALVQVLVVATALFAIPALRRLEQARPFLVPTLLMVPLLAVRFGAVSTEGLEIPTVAAQVIAWLFVLGWLAQRAETLPQRLFVSVLVVAALPGFFDEPSREAIVAGGVLLAMWVPRVVVPAPLHRIVGVVAGASLYIYLVHFFVFAEVRDARGPWAAVAASMALGVLAWLAVERGRRHVVDPVRVWVRQRRDTGPAWRTPEANPSM